MQDYTNTQPASDVDLRNALFEEYGKDVQVDRVRKKLVSILGTEVAENYKATENERSLLKLIYSASTQFKNWIQYVNKIDTLNPHSLGNYEPDKGILKEEPIRVETLLNFWEQVTHLIQGDTQSLFVLKDNNKLIDFCGYGTKLMRIESKLSRYVNNHQRKHYDFYNQNILLNAGISTAIKYAESLIDKQYTTNNYNPYTVDNVFETVLKAIVLNRAKAQCGGKIETAKKNSKLDWLFWSEINGLLDICVESKTLTKFQVLETKYDLSSSDKEDIQKLLRQIITTRFSRQEEELEISINRTDNLTIMGYLLLSDKKRQEKLKVNHYGESNPNKSISNDYYTEDTINYYGDRYVAISGLTDLQRSDFNIATKALKAYFDVRIQKNELIIKLYDKLEMLSCKNIKGII